MKPCKVIAGIMKEVAGGGNWCIFEIKQITLNLCSSSTLALPFLFRTDLHEWIRGIFGEAMYNA